MQQLTKSDTVRVLSFYVVVLLALGCSEATPPTLNPLSQLDYKFVQTEDYRLHKISSKLRLAAYQEGYSLPPALSPLIIREAKPVAFSLATGEIILSDGLLSEIKDEAQLAAIIAHEYSHKLLNHFANLQGSNSINMTIDLKLELEADELSLKLLKGSAYRENAALKALQLLHRRIRKEVSLDWNEILKSREENLATLLGE